MFGRLLDATRAGATGAALYAAAARRRTPTAGFPGEELKHHQGGAIGYRAREWVAHPASQEVVQARQAFAWNPTITGTKIEDTALLVDGANARSLTTSPGWPAIELRRTVSARPNVWHDLNGVYAVPPLPRRRDARRSLDFGAAELRRAAYRGGRHHPVSLRRQRLSLPRRRSTNSPR